MSKIEWSTKMQLYGIKYFGHDLDEKTLRNNMVWKDRNSGLNFNWNFTIRTANSVGPKITYELINGMKYWIGTQNSKTITKL